MGARAWLAFLSVPTLAAVTALTLPSPATAEPPALATAPTLARAPAASQLVRLLTGDLVQYTGQPDGTTTVAVTPAERPGGQRVVFQTLQNTEGYHVIPSDAWPLLAAGTLDRQLFNVTTLVSDGLADADSVPVIVADAVAPPASAFADEPAATHLESIDAVAYEVDARQASELWRSLSGSEASLRTTSTPRVWLDRSARVALDQSVPQIGVPQARQAGFDGSGVTVAVLDTGYDPTHPDLAGRVTATENFTTDPSVVDRNGHGTHVASIVAGSGAASGGQFEGVAPGADLIVGKVLPDSGEGPTSAVIDGMEWAASQGADVINLSLGANATDGTDPASQAVDALTAQTGALFVIASGNNCAGPCVSSPGAASSALTVGAVDKFDLLAGFSNQGPRLGDAAVKPELTAPGVNIVAARAAGTTLGSPVDANYVASDGTSMASPHVAGAAAILAQAHPSWTWEDIKDALVSTSQPVGHTTFQGGAGRVNVAAAFDATVTGPASVNFGALPAPYNQVPTEQLTYRNHSSAPVTLSLSLSGQGWDGRALPAGGIALGRSTVTVPAGGTATVPLTVTAAAGEVGAYTGVVSANGGGMSLRTPFSYYKSTGSRLVTMTVLDYLGRPQEAQSVTAVKLDGALPNDPFVRPDTSAFTGPDGTVQLRLAEGEYDFYGISVTWDVMVDRQTITASTGVAVTADRSVTLDARNAVRVDPQMPEQTDLKSASFAYARGLGVDDGEGVFGPGLIVFYAPTDMYVQPAPAVSPADGYLEVRTQFTLASRVLTTARLQRNSQQVNFLPEYHSYFAAPLLAGNRQLPTVWAGSGSDAELDAVGVAGRVPLVRIPINPADPNRIGQVILATQAVSAAAAARGAAAVVYYVDLPGAPAVLQLNSTALLELMVSRSEGEQARLLLQGGGTGQLTLAGRLTPQRLYQLRYVDTEPGQLTQPTVQTAQLVAIPSRYHNDRPNATQTMFSYAFGPRERFGGGASPWYWAPMEVTEFVLPNADLRWHRLVSQVEPPPAAPDPAAALSSRERFRPGETRAQERWFESPMGIGAAENPLPTRWRDEICTNCRQGNIFRPGGYYLDSDARHYEPSFLVEGSQYRMFTASGSELFNFGGPQEPRFFLPTSAPATYRLELTSIQPQVPMRRVLAPEIRTSWTFTSSAPSAIGHPAGFQCHNPGSTDGCAFQPLLQPDYRLNLDLQNRVPAGASHTIGLRLAPHAGTDPALLSPISTVTFEFSTNDGQTWQQVTPQRNATDPRLFSATVNHPPLASTDGFVWLRLNAVDGNGNRVVQTIERAYALR